MKGVLSCKQIEEMSHGFHPSVPRGTKRRSQSHDEWDVRRRRQRRLRVAVGNLGGDLPVVLADRPY